MTATPDPVPGNLHWPEWVAVALSIFAVVVSGYTLVDGQLQHRDERASELMAQIYGDWDEMNLVGQWELAHLNEVPDTYQVTRDRLREYVSNLTTAERMRIEMQERLTAGRIFGFFEHHLNQWRIANEAQDTHRIELLEVELDYWFEEFLRNPRLLWFFAQDGGGMTYWLDPPNRKIYEQRVLHDPQKPLTQEPDPIGILVPAPGNAQ